MDEKTFSYGEAGEMLSVGRSTLLANSNRCGLTARYINADLAKPQRFWMEKDLVKILTMRVQNHMRTPKNEWVSEIISKLDGGK